MVPAFNAAVFPPVPAMPAATGKPGGGKKRPAAQAAPLSALGGALAPEIAELTGHWQLFLETLVRGYQCASFLVQENIETDRGRLSCSHRPEMDKVRLPGRTRGGASRANPGAATPPHTLHPPLSISFHTRNHLHLPLPIPLPLPLLPFFCNHCIPLVG